MLQGLRQATRPLSIVLLVVLAGCSSPAADVPDVPEGRTLEGWVLDPTLRPVAGATVRLLATGNETTTDEDGHYRLTNLPDLPVHTLRATAAGYEEQARSVSYDGARHRTLNFSLAPFASVRDHVQVHQFDGFIECSAFASAEHSHGGGGPPEGENPADCGTYATTESTWTVDIQPGAAGLVVEVVWEPGTTLAENLLLIVSQQLPDGTLDFLAFSEGQSPIKAHVPAFEVQQRFELGGTILADVQIGGSDEDVAVGAAIQQGFEGFTSTFFGSPPDALYTVT